MMKCRGTGTNQIWVRLGEAVVELARAWGSFTELMGFLDCWEKINGQMFIYIIIHNYSLCNVM